MLEQRRGRRLKTEGDRMAEELQRQKSIFSHLNHQVQQKNRKISFLQGYYVQLQALVQKEMQEDQALQSRAHRHLNRQRQAHPHKSNILERLQCCVPKRLATEGPCESEGRGVASSVSLTSPRLRRSRLQR